MKAKYAVVTGPISLMHVDLGRKGGVRLVVCIEGVQAHTSRPWLGVNAFERAVFIASELLGDLKPRITSRIPTYPSLDENSKKATIELGGNVRRGTKSSTLPAEFCFKINRRVLPEESFSEALNEIPGFIEKLRENTGLATKCLLKT